MLAAYPQVPVGALISPVNVEPILNPSFAGIEGKRSPGKDSVLRLNPTLEPTLTGSSR